MNRFFARHEPLIYDLFSGTIQTPVTFPDDDARDKALAGILEQSAALTTVALALIPTEALLAAALGAAVASKATIPSQWIYLAIVCLGLSVVCLVYALTRVHLVAPAFAQIPADDFAYGEARKLQQKGRRVMLGIIFLLLGSLFVVIASSYAVRLG